MSHHVERFIADRCLARSSPLSPHRHQGHYAILERAAGQCIEARHTYEYGADNLDDLIVYSNPQCRADQQTGYALQPGDRFEGNQRTYTAAVTIQSLCNRDFACVIVIVIHIHMLYGTLTHIYTLYILYDHTTDNTDYASHICAYHAVLDISCDILSFVMPFPTP